MIVLFLFFFNTFFPAKNLQKCKFLVLAQLNNVYVHLEIVLSLPLFCYVYIKETKKGQYITFQDSLQKFMQYEKTKYGFLNQRRTSNLLKINRSFF
jgi:hypothetical protein